MSPVISHERPPRRDLMINGLRPSPLKISKDSHCIQKPSAGVVSQAAPAHLKQQQRQGPLIIYTHSPKIIHTQARDFMTLVQTLTGFSRPDVVNETVPSQPRKNHDSFSSLEGDINTKLAATEENGGFNVTCGDVNNVSSSYVPTTVSPTNAFFADIPLFTPNSTDFLCSPRPVYKFADKAIVSPTFGNLSSPSLLEFMKGHPDY